MTKAEIQEIFSSVIKQNIAIVDVRTPIERVQITVPHTIHIPLNELQNRISEIEKFDKVYFFCKAGVRAEQATELACDSNINAFLISKSVYEVMDIATNCNFT